MPETTIETTSQTSADATTRQKAATRSSAFVRPVRTVAILGAVGALVAAIALPAFVSTSGAADAAPVTTEQLAAGNAQSIVVASEATQAPSTRGQFTATTPDEIEKRKAEEAAAARAASAAAAAAASTASTSSSRPSLAGMALVAPGSGAVRYPVTSFTPGEGPGSGRGHEGWDMIAPEGTPIYAAAAGTVTASAESIGGYGVSMMIMSNLNGTMVETRYGHMVYGSRMVEAGDQVSAGQLIGLVGNTGNSYGSHLHFEVRIGGSVIDPEPWLAANAG
ncbi:M23 family metallopeptidase [Microbacterium azadirachtae]|uniref:Murein DD-endopeptidase MepM n=1 Tax=Microbacterium azadirachtae TaxID=582680 RepID=A0A0F0LF80_9MICO|nr:M23 family metallopeptidase [Microbacterium azadirachtae]KJL31344.1 Murein DD-endopeptidase MepM [Microbacterium azadirachtae]